MRVMYVAEIVGKVGIYSFRKALPELKSRYPWDFLIACADGATGGGGLGRNHAAYLHKLGANVLTTGENCFFKKDLTESIEKLPFVLRPDNLNPQAPGFGSRIYKAAGKKIAVAVLLGQNGFGRLRSSSPFAVLPALLERLRQETPYVIIDFHAQATAEKKTLFFAADGRCSAVIGSHTRVQTSDNRIFPGGTAVICDAGRTGSTESVGGCDTITRIQEYLTGVPEWTKDAWEKPELQGVYFELDDNGKARSIERVRIPISVAPESPSAKIHGGESHNDETAEEKESDDI